MISRTKVKPDVICVSESKLQDKKIEWQKKLVNIPNYKLVYDNSKTNAGGVAVYINEAIKNFKVMSEHKLKLDDCESIFIEMYFDKKDKSKANNKQTVLLGCVYRHPRYDTTLFVSELFEKLSIYSEKNIPMIIVGDINIDGHDKSDRTFKYINALASVIFYFKLPTTGLFETSSCRQNTRHNYHTFFRKSCYIIVNNVQQKI